MIISPARLPFLAIRARHEQSVRPLTRLGSTRFHGLRMRLKYP